MTDGQAGFLMGLIFATFVVLILWHGSESVCQQANDVADCVFSGFVPAVPEKDHPNGQ